MELFIFCIGMLVLGSGVGIVSAALGVGGGLFMVPGFAIFIDGMDINTAKGSSLLIIMFVAGVNSWRMNRGDMKSPWDVAALIVLGSIAGGYLGGWVTTFMSERTVTILFVSLLTFAALRLFFLRSHQIDEDQVRKRRALSSGLGFVTGIVAGATGTGGGAVFVPLVLWAGIVSHRRVVALSNTVMMVTCGAGALAHLMAAKSTDLPWTYGLITVSFAPLVFLGAVASAPLGRWINTRLTIRLRGLVMACLLIVISLRLLYKTFG